MIKLFNDKMIIKEPTKTNCLYCLKSLLDSKEIELHYHISCKKAMDKFENEDKGIIEFLSKGLSLTEKQIEKFLLFGEIKYILDKNEKLKELTISSSASARKNGIMTNLINHINLSTPELQELRILSITCGYGWDHDWGRYNSDLMEVQENIGELKNLEVLNLTGNTLSALPESIVNLTNLKELILSGNEFKLLPNVVTKLTNLEILNLSDNPLLKLPDNLLDLSNLQQFYLTGKVVKNSIENLPESFEHLRSLITLDLSQNNLSSFPSLENSKLENLKNLNLEDNQFQNLPKAFEKLINLSTLNLKHNKLTILPKSIGNLKNLVHLFLDNNKLSSLPKSIGEMINLKTLSLTDNSLKIIPELLEN